MLRLTQMFIPGTSKDWSIFSLAPENLKRYDFDDEEANMNEDNSISYGIADAAKENSNYQNLLQLFGINTRNNAELYESWVKLCNFKDNNRNESGQSQSIQLLIPSELFQV